MRKESTIGIAGIGVHAVMPKAATAPRRAPAQRAKHDDDASLAPEQATPPPGMGKLVDKTS